MKKTLIPQSLPEAVVLVSAIHAAQIRMARVVTWTKAAIQKINDKLTAACSPLHNKIREMGLAVFAFAQAHRKTLTKNGKTKTVRLANGWALQWRIKKPSVELLVDEDVAVAHLIADGLERFVRRAPTVNRQAILDDPTAVANLKYLQIKKGEETFEIVPPKTPGGELETLKFAI